MRDGDVSVDLGRQAADRLGRVGWGRPGAHDQGYPWPSRPGLRGVKEDLGTGGAAEARLPYVVRDADDHQRMVDLVGARDDDLLADRGLAGPEARGRALVDH